MAARCILLAAALSLIAPLAFGHLEPIDPGPALPGDPLPHVHCEDGTAGAFACLEIDLLAQLPVALFGAQTANDVWGWTDPETGREVALLGLNIGKNAATPIERAADDYLIGLAGVYPFADYVTVNISSPNTKNLRALQSDEALDALLGTLQERRQQLIAEHGRSVPMFVKIAPDLDESQVEVIAQTLKKNAIDGVIATNTSTHIAGFEAELARARCDTRGGGLSGAPLREKSRASLKALRAALGPDFPIIGVGGLMSAADVRARRDDGASLLQLYTGFVYRGPGLLDEIFGRLDPTPRS